MVASNNLLKGWQVERAAVSTIGRDLQRPECILAERNGTLWAADARGGATRIAPDGSQQLITSYVEEQMSSAASFADRYVQAQGSLPNGLAFDENGDFIIANWGTDTLETMTRDGRVRMLYTEIDGQPLGKANFVLRDSKNRIWLTVTTREQRWTKQLNTRTADGYVALIDEKGIRIVAEGFCGTNEVRLDLKEEWLYVVESTGRHISRLHVQPDGSLTDREIYGPSQLDGFPDGFALDAFGNLWVTLIFTDQLVAITPDGEVLNLLDDSNPTMIAYASKGETLWPGEMLGSGTVGTGSGAEHGKMLQLGDVVELQIQGIGTLRNRIGQSRQRGWELEQRKKSS